MRAEVAENVATSTAIASGSLPTPLPPERLARSFEPRFTTKPGGAGLGLATVARIVRQSEGYVHLDSEIGDGTTVSVLLPAEG